MKKIRALKVWGRVTRHTQPVFSILSPELSVYLSSSYGITLFAKLNIDNLN